MFKRLFLLLIWSLKTEMSVGSCGRNPSSGCTLQIPLLDQIRLKHIFDSIFLFPDRGGQIIETHRPPP